MPPWRSPITARSPAPRSTSGCSYGSSSRLASTPLRKWIPAQRREAAFSSAREVKKVYARSGGVPLKDVQAAAMKAFLDRS